MTDGCRGDDLRSAGSVGDPIGGHGLVVGKFLPPHLGHHLLVDTAEHRCRELVVVVSAKSSEPIPLGERVRWMEQRHPSAVITGILDDHPVDFDSDATWRHWADRFRLAWREATLAPPAQGAPDVLFSSEPYGEELARRIGSRHASVDPERSALPVSGTIVRDDPFAAWDYLEPPVRAYFRRRVLVADPALAEELTARYDTDRLEVSSGGSPDGTPLDLVLPVGTTTAAAVVGIDEVLARPWSGRAYRPHEPGDRARRFVGEPPDDEVPPSGAPPPGP